MKTRYALTLAAFATMLHGCIWAPGQHLSSHKLVRGDSLDESRVELTPITPKLIAMDQADRVQATLPDALLAYHPGAYRIGAGDSLYITIWEHPELTAPAGPQQPGAANGRIVRSDGTLFFPYVGTLKVEGMTIEELRDAIASKLGRYMESPQVDVTVGTYASQRVVIQGAFVKTDPQAMTSVPLTLGQALGAATINTEQANLSNLVLTRDDQDYHLNLDALFDGEKMAKDIYLKPGDRLFLPYNDRQELSIVGEVVHPLAATFKTSDLTLSQALGRAGGLNQTSAKGNAIYVIRGSKNLAQAPSQVFQLEAQSPDAFGLASQFRVKPGDVIFVGAAGITRWNRFVSQLLPFSGIISNAARTGDELK